MRPKGTNKPPYQIPTQFKEKMEILLGDGYQKFLTSLDETPSAGLRVNTLKILPGEYLKISPYKLAPVPWCPGGFYLDEFVPESGNIPPGRHPHHNAGLYYLQEPSAMAAALILAPQPGEKVLDLSAAPGGKSTHLAGLMNNEGVLVANEIHPKRVWDLAENLERCGVTNAIVTNENPLRLAEHFGEHFDRVMLDAPCSGEGMFRKNESACMEWRPELPRTCAIRQYAILEQAARLVKPGGYLAYTTCTFSPEENEGVIASFLELHPEFDTVPIAPLVGFSPAHPEWCQFLLDEKIKRAVRIWPHQTRGEGHFIALLVKQGQTDKNQARPKDKPQDSKNGSKRKSLTGTNRTYQAFESSFLNISLSEKNILIKGTYVYHQPTGLPDLTGLKVIHPGWWLGTFHTDRFSPSHAFAMGLHTEQVKEVLDLKLGDQAISKYLHGESLISSGVDGWILVAVDGFPLGWGKRVQNVVKNYYPHGLRQS